MVDAATDDAYRSLTDAMLNDQAAGGSTTQAAMLARLSAEYRARIHDELLPVVHRTTTSMFIDPGQTVTALNDAMQRLLGRDSSEAEVQRFAAYLAETARNNPVVVTTTDTPVLDADGLPIYNADGTPSVTENTTTTGGTVDPSSAASGWVLSVPQLAAEHQDYLASQYSSDLQNCIGTFGGC